MPTSSPLDIARRFAAALDRCDFGEAAGYLAPDCRYEIGHEVLVGPDAVVASYRASDEWGRRVLHRVIYESEVEETADGISMLYTDRIIQDGETHEHRSHQRVWLNDDGQITRIVHAELPGEREQLEEFFKRHGIRR